MFNATTGQDFNPQNNWNQLSPNMEINTKE